MKSRRQVSKKPKQKSGLKKGVVRRATKKGLRVRRMSKKRMRGGRLTEQEIQAAAEYAAMITLVSGELSLLGGIAATTTAPARAAGLQAVKGAIGLVEGTTKLVAGATVVPALKFVGAMGEFVRTPEGQGAVRDAIPSLGLIVGPLYMRHGVIAPLQEGRRRVVSVWEKCREQLASLIGFLREKKVALSNIVGIRDCITLHTAMLQSLTEAYKVIIRNGDLATISANQAVQQAAISATQAVHQAANRQLIEQYIGPTGSGPDSQSSASDSEGSYYSLPSSDVDSDVDSLIGSVRSLRPVAEAAEAGARGVGEGAAAEAPVGVADAVPLDIEQSQDVDGAEMHPINSQPSDGSDTHSYGSQPPLDDSLPPFHDSQPPNPKRPKSTKDGDEL